MKCKCGIELFQCDIVEGGFQNPEYAIYRCPKCYIVKRVKLKNEK